MNFKCNLLKIISRVGNENIIIQCEYYERYSRIILCVMKIEIYNQIFEFNV